MLLFVVGSDLSTPIFVRWFFPSSLVFSAFCCWTLFPSMRFCQSQGKLWRRGGASQLRNRSKKKLVGQVLVMFCGPLLDSTVWTDFECCFFCRSNLWRLLACNNFISMLCWHVLDICHIHPYSVFCYFALSCFVGFSFKMGTTYSRNATEILESDHQDLSCLLQEGFYSNHLSI